MADTSTYSDYGPGKELRQLVDDLAEARRPLAQIVEIATILCATLGRLERTAQALAARERRQAQTEPLTAERVDFVIGGITAWAWTRWNESHGGDYMAGWKVGAEQALSEVRAKLHSLLRQQAVREP